MNKPGSLTRIWRALIGTLLSPTLGPEKRIRNALVAMNQDLETTRIQIARAIRDTQSLSRKISGLCKTLENLKTSQLSADREHKMHAAANLARRIEGTESILGMAKSEKTEQEATIVRLTSRFHALEQEIIDTQAQLDLLLIRKNRAETGMEASTLRSRGPDGQDVGLAFDQLSIQVAKNEVMADVLLEMDERLALSGSMNGETGNPTEKITGPDHAI